MTAPTPATPRTVTGEEAKRVPGEHDVCAWGNCKRPRYQHMCGWCQDEQGDWRLFGETPEAPDHARELAERDAEIAELKKQINWLQDERDDYMVQRDKARNRDSACAHKLFALQRQAEDKRVERWWDTYNACLSRPSAFYAAERIHSECTTQANLAHGPLTPMAAGETPLTSKAACSDDL